MRHLTRSPARPGCHGLRRSVLAGTAATVLALGSVAPVAALDDTLDSTSEGEVDEESSEEGSSSTSSLDETIDDTSESIDDTSESVDDTSESLDETVDERVEETEESLGEVTDPLLEEEDADEEPDEPDEGDDSEAADDPETDDDEGEDAASGQPERTERREEAPRAEPEPQTLAEEDGEATEDDGDEPSHGARYLDAGPFDPPGPRAPSPLLRTGYEPVDFDLEVADPLVAESRSARDTDEVLAMLRTAEASESTIARLLAPFPLAGPASYGDDGTHEVRLRTTAGTPVVAAGTGTVAVTDADRGLAVELTGHDGTTYRYEGMRESTLGVADGEEVRFGQTLGHVAGFDLSGSTLTFALWSPDGERLPALHYLDRWLAEAEAAADELAGAHQGTFAPDVAPPADRGTELAAPEGTAADQSGMAPARAEGGPATATLGGLLVGGLGAYLALRTRRRPLLEEDREGFLSAVDELGPRA